MQREKEIFYSASVQAAHTRRSNDFSGACLHPKVRTKLIINLPFAASSKGARKTITN
jgi:hypothetical protein